MYRLKYDLTAECGEFSKEDLKDEDCGACDALVLGSLLYPEDGSFSLAMTSWDGRHNGEPLEDNELFKVWMLLGLELADKETSLPGWRGLILKHVAELLRK